MWNLIRDEFSNHFILLGVAICVTLVAIWAGKSRLHWFLRGSVVAAVLALFLPVRAHEPLLFFLLAAPVVSLGVAWMESRRERTPMEGAPTGADSNPKRSRQLSLSGAFLLLGLVGMACGLGSAAFRGGLMMDWRCLPISALTFASVAILSYRVGAFSQGIPHRWAQGVSFMIAAGLFAWYALLGKNYLFAPATSPLPVVIGWWSGSVLVCLGVFVVWYCGLRFGSPRHFTALVGVVFVAPRIELDGLGDWMFAGYLSLQIFGPGLRTAGLVILTIAYGLFAAVIVASAAIGRLTSSTTAPAWKKNVARAASFCAASLLLCFLGSIYWRLAWILALPAFAMVEASGENPLEKALPLLDEFYALEYRGRGFVFVPGDHPKALKRHDPKEPIADIYAQLVEQLQKPGWVPIDSRYDASSSSRMSQQLVLQKLLAFSEILEADADQAMQRKDFDAAVPYAMAQMQLEDNLHRRGFVMHRGFGTTGVMNMATLQKDVSTANARQVLASLRRFERQREPIEVSLQREQAWEERAIHWRSRLRRLKNLNAPILGSAISSRSLDPLETYRESNRPHLAYQRLLATELALRLFQEDQGRLPRKLDELVPKYLDEVPLDPFSVTGQALVYRATGGKHRLYTVWTNGLDDGGRKGNGSAEEFRDDFPIDFDLDTVVRLWAWAKEQAKIQAATAASVKASMLKAQKGGGTTTAAAMGSK